MSDQQLTNLIKMLEQIIANNLHQGTDEEVAAVAADHLYKFWARSMKQHILNYAKQHPTELSAIALLACSTLTAATQNSSAAQDNSELKNQ